MEPLALTVLALASLLAGFTQGFTGFGSTVVALPLMVLVFDLKAAVPAGCLMALAINVFMVAHLHGHIDRRALGRLLIGALPGMAAGVWMLGSASPDLLKGLLGMVVLFVIGLTLYRPVPTATPRAAGGLGVLVAGFASGCLGVSLGINGPPVVAWAAGRGYCRNALRATMTGYFLLAGICVVSVQTGKGLMTRDVAWMFAVELPAVLAGVWAGSRLCGRVGDTAFRRAILGLLAVTALTLVWQAAKAIV